MVSKDKYKILIIIFSLVSLSCDNKDRIISIICKDKMYSTVEGIGVGSTLQELKGVTDNIVASKDGWTNVVEMPISKWSAAFDSRIKPTDSSKVKFLYYVPN